MRKSSSFTIVIILFISLTTILSISSPVFGAGGAPVGDVEANFTTQDVIELFAYILLALFFSFLCSVAEAVLLNITPSYLADLTSKQPKYAEKVSMMRITNIDNSLAGILTMNTIAHTVGAIGSGAKATIVFGSVWFGVFSTVMTLAILFVSEIVPKTVGVVYWKQLVRPVMLYIGILTFILAPFIWVSEKLTQLIAKDKKVSAFNRDEFVAMANLGVTNGAFSDRESQILSNLFKLGSITIKSIYTPRTVMFAIQEDKTIEDVFKENKNISISRIIVYNQDLEQVTGFVHINDMVAKVANNLMNTTLKELKRPILVFPIFTTVSEVLDKFLKEKQHIALVVDEFGTKGLVTIEDVFETLLGIEIVDESDKEADMQVLAKELWRKRMDKLGLDSKYIQELEEAVNNPTKKQNFD
jgi:CBS domain containing-hemolysin-like protein